MVAVEAVAVAVSVTATDFALGIGSLVAIALEAVTPAMVVGMCVVGPTLLTFTLRQ